MTDAYAVITPAGELHWYPLARAKDVEAMVGGTVAPGALDTATLTVTGIPPGCGPLKVIASDIGALYPADYPVNPLAGRVLAVLSGGRRVQDWHGTVAITEYEVDPDTREVLWPGEMSPRWIDVVEAAVRRAREAATPEPDRTPVGPNCPGCGEPPVMLMGGGTQAFCGTDDCPWFTWDPTKTLAELNAETQVIDLSGGTE